MFNDAPAALGLLSLRVGGGYRGRAEQRAASSRANLRNGLVEFMQTGEAFLLPPAAGLYAVAYRPIKRDSEQIDLWGQPRELGQALPTLPLSLNAQLSVPVDLEATYSDACQRRRLP